MSTVWMKMTIQDAPEGTVVREPEGTRLLVSDGEGWWSFLPPVVTRYRIEKLPHNCNTGCWQNARCPRGVVEISITTAELGMCGEYRTAAQALWDESFATREQAEEALARVY